ncbi:hypothetical protein Pint_02955 [Pistacia integerrima]|uniref:Uncharacterized protein n=1 Tax=Pistacia integerrima TaxID=434235 RepID=A0ACC0ZJV1_9ROSI|nr:hypothetical protein Pint_02955 [Pistacia integerrima]
MEYFESVGIRGPFLPKFLCSDKRILMSSLKNHIIPTFDFLKGFVETNENLISALKQSTRVISNNVQKQMGSNMNTLRAHGVPEPLIVRLIMLQPQSLLLRPDMFENVVNAIKEMGFEPTRRSFIMGVRAMSTCGKAKWESKKEILMSYGWSESDFLLAFKRQTMIMLCSVKKIRILMDFFVKNMGLKSSDIVRCPNLLMFSLERRIIPRVSALKVVMSKKLSKKDIDVVWHIRVRWILEIHLLDCRTTLVEASVEFPRISTINTNKTRKSKRICWLICSANFLPRRLDCWNEIIGLHSAENGDDADSVIANDTGEVVHDGGVTRES